MRLYGATVDQILAEENITASVGKFYCGDCPDEKVYGHTLLWPIADRLGTVRALAVSESSDDDAVDLFKPGTLAASRNRMGR